MLNFIFKVCIVSSSLVQSWPQCCLRKVFIQLAGEQGRKRTKHCLHPGGHLCLAASGCVIQFIDHGHGYQVLPCAKAATHGAGLIATQCPSHLDITPLPVLCGRVCLDKHFSPQVHQAVVNMNILQALWGKDLMYPVGWILSSLPCLVSRTTLPNLPTSSKTLLAGSEADPSCTVAMPP